MTDDDKDDINFDDDEENNDMLESLKIKNDDDEPKQTVLEEQNEETIQPSTSTYEEDTNEIIFENIEPSDHIALYVSNPTLIKDTIGSYFNYTVQGTKVPEPIIRRFRDFDTLRSKLRLRWPGIFLPRLPHRKKFGNNEKEVVDIRVEMINAFFIKLSSLTKIFNSEEVALFIKNDSDSMKKLSELQMENYQDLFFKYAQAFPDGNNEFDVEASKEKIKSFYNHLRSSLPHRKELMNTITKIKENYITHIKGLNDIFSLFNLYEKEWLSKIRGNDKLILRNVNNTNISSCMSQLETSAKTQDTPYDSFYNKIMFDSLIAEAYIETYESLMKLIEEKEKMDAKLKEINHKLESNKTGKKSFATLIRLKSVDEENTNLAKEKENLERDLSNLTNVVNICIYNMKKDSDKQRVFSLKEYYRELDSLRKDIQTKSLSQKQFYDYILEEHNIETTS